jgi:hypothetical protein
MGRRGQHGPSVDFEENETERERREDIDVRFGQCRKDHNIEEVYW